MDEKVKKAVVIGLLVCIALTDLVAPAAAVMTPPPKVEAADRDLGVWSPLYGDIEWGDPEPICGWLDYIYIQP